MNQLIKISKILIFILSFIVLWSILEISLIEWNTGDGCPKIFDFPVCHLILGLVIILLLSQMLNGKYNIILFALGAGVPWIIAAFASYMQYNGLAECPKSENGIPMCYLSLLIFSILWALWYFKRAMELRSN